MEWLIKSYSNEGDTVLDNCMGSGTTAVAAIRTNRNFIGIEKEKSFYTIAKSRVQTELYAKDEHRSNTLFNHLGKIT